MSIHIDNAALAKLVTEPAKLRGVSEEDAVRHAVEAESERAFPASSLRDRFSALRAAHPLPPRTGQAADKEFSDDLSSAP